jgi:hypothetical protein
VAPVTEEFQEGLSCFGHVHGIVPFWFPAPERNRWRGHVHKGASEPFPVASTKISSGQAAATGEQIARAVAQMKLTFIPPL